MVRFFKITNGKIYLTEFETESKTTRNNPVSAMAKSFRAYHTRNNCHETKRKFVAQQVTCTYL